MTAELFPKSSVARAFSHQLAETLWLRGRREPGRWGIGYAADDNEPRHPRKSSPKTGFAPIRVGTLADSAPIDPGGVLFPGSSDSSAHKVCGRPSIRGHSRENCHAAGDTRASATSDTECSGPPTAACTLRKHAPVLITENQVAFSTAATAPVGSTRRRWLDATPMGGLVRILTALTQPRPHYPRRELALFRGGADVSGDGPTVTARDARRVPCRPARGATFGPKPFRLRRRTQHPKGQR